MIRMQEINKVIRIYWIRCLTWQVLHSRTLVSYFGATGVMSQKMELTSLWNLIEATRTPKPCLPSHLYIPRKDNLIKWIEQNSKSIYSVMRPKKSMPSILNNTNQEAKTQITLLRQASKVRDWDQVLRSRAHYRRKAVWQAK